MKHSRIAFAIVLVGSILRFTVKYPDPPATVASHFGADGEPNGWMSRSVFAWFSAIPLGAALLGFFVFVHELVFIANTDSGGRLPEVPFLAGLAGFLVFTVLRIVALYRRFRNPPA